MQKKRKDDFFMKAKRILSALIAGTMAISAFSFSAFATAEPVEPVATEELIAAEDTESNEIELMSAEDSWIDNANTDWYNNTDTEFTLTTADQLAGLAQLVIDGNNFSGKTIKLGDDIDLAGKNWTPIGGETKAFYGTFDGGNFSVKNMTAKNSYDYGNGFFHSLIGPATVKNVSFNNAKVYKSFYYSGNVYGIVSGYAYGNVTFENIHVTDSWVRGYGKVGAILGMAADPGGVTTVKDCTVNNVKVYGVYNSATFIGTSQNPVNMTGCSYSDVSWVPYWAEEYYPIDTTVANSGEIVNGLFWKYSIWYYAAWSDLYNVYKGSVALSDVSGLEWSEGSDADGWCVNDYASIGNTQYSSLQEAIDAAVEGDTVTLRRNYKNDIVSADKKITFKTGGYIMPNVLLNDPMYLKNNGDGTYTVTDSSATVIDTDRTASYTITLNNLKNNVGEHVGDAVYSLALETASKAGVDAITEKINSTENYTPDEVQPIDIKVYKTVDGASEDITNDVKNQPVTIKLQNKPKSGTVKVYHYDGENVTVLQGDDLTVDYSEKTVSFTAPSFSDWAVAYDIDSATLTATSNVGLLFEKSGEVDTYNIVLRPEYVTDTIYRFMSADLTFALDSETLSYEIIPAANVNLIDNGNDRYEFNLNGTGSSGITGNAITIGKVKFSGIGTGSFKVAEAETNIVNTAKLDTVDDSIVVHYVAGGSTGYTLTLNDDATNHINKGDGNGKGTIDGITLTAEKKPLTINVAFPNNAANNGKAYQAMSVKIGGGDIAEQTIELGNDNTSGHFTAADGTNGRYDVSYNDADSNNPAYYTVTITDGLTKNVTYNVTVSGAGYRTARYTVNMNTVAGKTLNFWNNVKDDENSCIEEGMNAGKGKTNFLAGDIVKDNNINIYDLSAVVSYFGKINSVTGESAYAKYDLNRDGKIDSKDVAYVLVSWGN